RGNLWTEIENARIVSVEIENRQRDGHRIRRTNCNDWSDTENQREKKELRFHKESVGKFRWNEIIGAGGQHRHLEEANVRPWMGGKMRNDLSSGENNPAAAHLRKIVGRQKSCFGYGRLP